MTEVLENQITETEEMVPVSNLIEACHFDGAVCEEEGLIKNVKILGFKSANGREYTPEAIAKSSHLYEGRPVYVNHRTGPGNKMGDAYDRFGTICNPRTAADGLRGDLRYLPSHRLAECVKDDLRLGLKCFGLSHEADGAALKDNPRKIGQITRVVRVDLVSEPATTTSLLEQTMPENTKTVQEQIDAAVAPLKETLTTEIANLREQLKQASKYLAPVQTRVTEQTEPTLGVIPSDPEKFKTWMRTA